MNDDLDEDVVATGEGFDEFAQKSNLGDKIRANPAIKVGIVLTAVAVIVGIALLFGQEEQPIQPSALPAGSDVASAPGTQEATPAYIAAVEQQNEENLEQALKKGESTIPVPIETQKDRLQIPEQEEKSEDPLHKWRKLQEERIERDLREQQAVEAVTVLDSQQQADAVKKLSETMNKQMQSILSKNVQRKTFTYVGVFKKEQVVGAEGGAAGTPGGTGTPPTNGGAGFEEGSEKTIIISTGDIEYAQTLIEANSDIQGPVLAQLLTGPLKGARLIGTFSVAEDSYLVLNFTTAVVNGKDYSISAIALDPDTSLAGVVTDVDHRYLRRILLPAASAFIEGFASAVAETGRTDVVVSGGTSGAVTSETEEADDEQRVAAGVEEAAGEITEIIDDYADVRPLVTIKAGTPIGVLFTAPVEEQEEDI